MIADYLLAGQLAARCGLSEQELEIYEWHGVIRGITKNRRRYYSAHGLHSVATSPATHAGERT